jgi:hypothetical protein
LLRVNKEGGNFLASPLLFFSWDRYLVMLNANTSKQTTMIETIIKSYGKKRPVKILQAAHKDLTTQKRKTRPEVT